MRIFLPALVVRRAQRERRLGADHRHRAALDGRHQQHAVAGPGGGHPSQHRSDAGRRARRARPPRAGSVGNAQLEPGANSFTEGQVRSRLEQAGFMNVTELRKDDQGIWRGKAMQNGRSVTVGFDFKGNVAAQ